MDAQRQETLDLLQQSGERFSSRVTAFTEVEWGASAGQGWTIAQVAEHIALVEMSSGKFIERKIFAAPADPATLAQTAGKDQVLRRWMPVRARRVEAPAFVVPRATWPTRDELLSAFWRWRATTTALLADPARDPRQFAGPHPVWGMLDACQWGLSLALHIDRHMTQIDEILRADQR